MKTPLPAFAPLARRSRQAKVAVQERRLPSFEKTPGLTETIIAAATRFGGNGTVVFFGLAKPVRTPLIGPVQQP